MFEQAFLPGAARTRRTWTVAVSFAGQVFGIGVLILIPLLVTEKLPSAQLNQLFFAPPPPPRPRPKAPPHVDIVAVERAPAQAKPVFTAPTYIPPKPQMIVDPPREAVQGGEGPDTGVEGGIDPAGPAQHPAITNVLKHMPPPPPATAPAPAPKPREEKIAQLPVGGKVQEAKLIHKVIPVYPPLAIGARVSGVVNLSAIIGADGRVRELRVINGHPLLIRPAVDAVRQWTYKPTLLNGQPVEVITTIEVRFNLGR